MNFHLFIICTMLSIADNPVDKHRNALEAIRTAYEANRASFDTFDCRFLKIAGVNDREEFLRTGELQDAFSTECLYAYSTTQHIIEHAFPDDMLTECFRLAKDTGASPFLNSFRGLADGKYMLLHRSSATSRSTVSHKVAADADAHLLFSIFAFPLSLGFPETLRSDLGISLQAILLNIARTDRIYLGESRAIPGGGIIEIAVSGSDFDQEWHLDPEKDYAPVLSILRFGDGESLTFRYLDYRPVSGKGWFPFETRRIMSPRSCEVTKIREIKAAPPANDRFELTFPRPIPVLNRTDQLLYAPQKTWRVSALPKASSPRARSFKPAIRFDELPPLEPEQAADAGGSARFVLFGVLAAIAGAFGLARVSIRR